MTGEIFIELHNDARLRDFIIRQARRHSRYRENQEDFIQEAWIRISLCPQDCDINYYEKQALRAIQAAYQKRRRKRKWDLEDGELMDRDVYNAWQHGSLRKW